MTGDVFIKHGDEDWADISGVGQKLVVGDLIQTGPDSSATLHFLDGSTLDMKPLTQLAVGTLLTERGRAVTQLLLKVGEIKARVAHKETVQTDFSIKTPTATTSSRGTVFTVKHDAVSYTHLTLPTNREV